MKKSKISLALLTLLFAVFFAIPGICAKDYSLEKAFINMHLGADGTISVIENITFSFSGPFSFAYRDFDYGTEQVSDFKVYEQTDEGINEIKFESLDLNKRTKRIKWYYSAQDETQSFIISYKIKNALLVYDDVVDFNWKVWGDSWDKQLKNLEGSFTFPEKVNGSSEVYTYGHPALNGKIAMLGEKIVIFKTSGIPSNQWVEVRIVFPRYVLKNPKNVRFVDGAGLSKILAQEADFSQSYSYDYSEIILRQILSSDPKLIVLSLVVILSPVFMMICIFVLLWFWKGREPKVKGYNAIFEREIPYKYSPALVSALINQHNKKPVARDFVAVILNLCIKGSLRLQVIKKNKFMGIFGDDKDYEINITGKKVELAKHEQIVLDEIKMHATAYKITFRNLQSEIMKDIGFRKRFSNWQKQVKEEAIAEGFFSSGNIHMIYNIVCAVFFGLGIFFGQFLFFLFLPGLTGLLLNKIFRQALPRRSEKGALHYLKWINFKKFLKDMSLMQKYPPDAMIIWEKYLVYAVSLGVADKVEKEMKMLLPKDTRNSHIFIGGMNYASFNTAHFMNSIERFSTSFAGASGTSGSGRFGGGGGSGGGGGGGGAG